MSKGFSKIIFGVLVVLITIIAILGIYSLLNYQSLALKEALRKTEELTSKTEDFPPIKEIKPTEVENLELKEVSAPGPLPLSKTGKGADTLSEEKIIYWTNFQRENQGIEKLQGNDILNKVAEERLNDMFEKQYFEHISPDGVGVANVAQNFNYQYSRIGENLALGNFKDEQDLVDAWMESEGHRANILNAKFKEIGIAAKKDIFEGKKTFIAVQVFGTPLSECPAPNNTLKKSIEAENNEIDELINQAENLKNEIDDIKEESQDLYKQGQEMISQGNYDEIPEINKELEENNIEIQRKVDEYNNLVMQIDKLSKEAENLISNYNSQVLVFNQCIEQ